MKIVMAKQQAGKKAGTPKNNMPNFMMKRLSEGSFILILTGAFFVLLSLMTYQFSDPGWSHVSHAGVAVANSGGQVGAYIADALYFVFGYFSYLLPIAFVYVAWAILQDLRALKTLDQQALLLRTIGLALMIAGGCGLLNFETGLKQLDAMHGAGGLIGETVGGGWYQMLNLYGATLVLLAMFLVGTTWLTGLSWLKAIELVGFYTLLIGGKAYAMIRKGISFGHARVEQYKISQPKLITNSEPLEEKSVPKLFKAKVEKEKEIENKEKAAPVLIMDEVKPEIVKPAPVVVTPPAREFKEIRAPKLHNPGTLPSLDLLDKGEPGKPMGGYTHQELENLSRDVEQHLLDFGIQADVVAFFIVIERFVLLVVVIQLLRKHYIYLISPLQSP
jgi:DNA segregation ATPase FtsK/SpoIIIE, S-DNA-T family